MIINDKRNKKNLKLIDAVAVGTVFECDGELYIKTDNMYSESNAVELLSGLQSEIECDDEVTVVKARLVIEDEN